MNCRKKILYIHHGKGLGGAPLSLLYLIKHLDLNKYIPIVLFLHNSEATALYKRNNITIAGIVNRYDFSHTKVWWQRWYHLPRLARMAYDTIVTTKIDAPYWLNKIKPDLVHLNTSSLIAWGQAAHKLNIPVIWHIREPLAPGYFGLRKKIVENHVAKYSSMIIGISNHDAAPWKEQAKTAIIYNAVDSTIFNYAKKYNETTESTPKILFLGGLSQEKGTLVILKAFYKLLEKLPHAKLIIAGYFDINSLNKTAWYYPQKNFYSQASSFYYNAKKSITLIGPITNVAEIMSTSNVIVFPATQGHFARPVIEAGFMKKPVIASDLPPLNELVQHKKTGYLISHKDTALWSDTLYNLLIDKKLQRTLGENAFNFCKKHFDIKDQIKKIETIYEKLSLKINNKASIPND